MIVLFCLFLIYIFSRYEFPVQKWIDIKNDGEVFQCAEKQEDAGPTNNWLVAGCSGGSVFMVNLASSQKRMIENFMDDEIYGLTSLKQYKGKFCAVQDSQFTIKVFDVEKMANASITADPKSLCELEIKQIPKNKDHREDIYFGDNKLIEFPPIC